MPTRERVASFVSMMQNQQFLEVIPEFYTEDMTAQENGEPPRIGRDAQVANEQALLAITRGIECRAASYVVDGDRVAIQWVFEMTAAMSGRRCALEEIAYQTWRGDRICAERYFYDPAQMRALLAVT